MGYHFLTGATGLLGSNLLFDFARAGLSTVVLVRSSKLETARQRIEAVMSRWDKHVGYTLPRPVILEGSLSNERLGLNEQQLRWVSENVQAMVQNAASVTYYGKTRDDEPWRTNVQGTKHALEFCRRTGIREFHHVSTAYVCGRREGLVYEDELNVGQDMNTDYERSKSEGEALVRAADFIDPPTVYRVAIIIGDSRTGYTPTYHGFYVPLKLVHTMFSRIVLNDFQIEPLQEAIRIQGHERKNLVPVDWVAAAMTHILTHREHHGRTYHLAPERPVVSSLMRDSMVQAFLQFVDINKAAGQVSANGSEGWSFSYDEFKKYFKDQMAVYESYWKDDPMFDLTNLKRAVPHLPCPDVDGPMLVRLCKSAIEANFGWPKPPAVRVPFNVDEHLGRTFRPTWTSDAASCVGLQVNGLGGGEWELFLDRGKVAAFRQGRSKQCQTSFYLNSNTFERLHGKEITLDEAIRTAKVLVEGNHSLSVRELTDVLEQIVGKPAGSVPVERPPVPARKQLVSS